MRVIVRRVLVILVSGLCLASCGYTPGERAVTGGLAGGAGGAAVGAAAGGGKGALIGGGLGAVGGAGIGAATAP